MALVPVSSNSNPSDCIQQADDLVHEIDGYTQGFTQASIRDDESTKQRFRALLEKKLQTLVALTVQTCAHVPATHELLKQARDIVGVATVYAETARSVLRVLIEQAPPLYKAAVDTLELVESAVQSTDPYLLDVARTETEAVFDKVSELRFTVLQQFENGRFDYLDESEMPHLAKYTDLLADTYKAVLYAQQLLKGSKKLLRKLRKTGKTGERRCKQKCTNSNRCTGFRKDGKPCCSCVKEGSLCRWHLQL